jgi:protein-S-isoprenylcysteine O-methyltransferase Ste14
LVSGATSLLAYWADWFTAVNLVVIEYEEPTPGRRFGDAYRQYAEHVGPWLPRVRSGRPRS